ncbi:hypothetical protein HY570_02640 [Candidatus Micrarchaeota archaeon]|nr:hypothetical protein [Candidatus Micrarchaeota archaeon]
MTAESHRLVKITQFDYNGNQRAIGVLTGPKLRFSDIFPAIDSFNRENGTNLRLIGPDVAEHLLTRTTEWRAVSEHRVVRFPVNMVIAYEQPGKPIGPEIVFAFEKHPTVTLSVPEDHQGKIDIALCVINLTATDFVQEGGNVRLAVPKERLILVQAFPKDDGSYPVDPAILIPHGQQVADSLEARRLCRAAGISYVGPVTRGFEYYNIVPKRGTEERSRSPDAPHSAKRTVVASLSSFDTFQPLVEIA